MVDEMYQLTFKFQPLQAVCVDREKHMINANVARGDTTLFLLSKTSGCRFGTYFRISSVVARAKYIYSRSLEL